MSQIENYRKRVVDFWLRSDTGRRILKGLKDKAKFKVLQEGKLVCFLKKEEGRWHALAETTEKADLEFHHYGDAIDLLLSPDVTATLDSFKRVLLDLIGKKKLVLKRTEKPPIIVLRGWPSIAKELGIPK